VVVGGQTPPDRRRLRSRRTDGECILWCVETAWSARWPATCATASRPGG
jgi:hypothetical protein